MVAREGLVASGDPRRVKKAARSSGLMAAWLVLVAVIAAILAWLFANADETRTRWSTSQPHAVVALPTDVPSQWSRSEPAPAPGPAPAPAPAPQAAPTPAPAPAPVAQA